jgi:hypothetical protein
LGAARLIEAVDLILFFVLVRQCVGRTDAALAGAVLLLVTPAHVAFRTASLNRIWPLPVILASAVAGTVVAQRASSRSPSVLRWRPPADALAAAGVVAAVAPTAALIAWRGAAWQRAATVAAWFWNFYLPSHLFLDPDAPGLSGMFLTATAVPMGVGLYALIRAGRDEDARLRVARLLIAGACLGAPLIAAIAGPPPLDGRASSAVPFGVLLAVVGACRMWTHGRLVGRVALGVVAVLAAIQAAFYRA